jgi:hypothetical protein
MNNEIESDKTVLGKLENIKHIHEVRRLLSEVIVQLDERAREHDLTKLDSPEKEIYGEFYPELKKHKYNTPEYTAMLEKMAPALSHHYAKNRHHPQHWPEGINDMTLIDLIEMFCDWMASSSRNLDGNIRKSIEANKTRFGMSDQLTQIFENTIREFKT